MALSVRLDASLQAQMERESRRLGITKSEFVKDAIERVLGLKNPSVLLKQVRSRTPMRKPDLSSATGAALKAKLRAKRPA